MSFKTVDGKLVPYTFKDHFKEYLAYGTFLAVIGCIVAAFYYFDWSFQKVIQTIFGLWMAYCAIAAGSIVVYYCLEALFQKYNIKSKILFWCAFLLLAILAIPIMFILQNSCDFNILIGQCN
ncbi:hypothetical protein [Pseudoalteromonas sp. MMG022]|uniref:hypothetical protein n=1 Tax=Pseudoalteromonas sp. MMG022 TaxID=2909978 RepID=UPI001F3F0E49|nr:hypothetical protein [Pseudoalteromonas sp. MMG022]MCF6436248.1 hypothetical protein [Pseudoalteromonas sp. MMG022]